MPELPEVETIRRTLKERLVGLKIIDVQVIYPNILRNETVESFKDKYTVAIVTHNMQQAARISDVTAFFFKGEIIEVGTTREFFTNPKNKQTEDYITGRFG